MGATDHEEHVAGGVERLLRSWSPEAVVEGELRGNRNRLWLVRIAGRRYVARLSTRPEPALQWEIDLLEHLRQAGMTVPEVLPARDGCRQVNGMVLQSRLDGLPPATERDWRRVADTLSVLHEITAGWPQRPAFLSTRDLLLRERGGDVRLDLMPPDAVSLVRQTWRAIANEPASVVHGDPGAGNILLHDGRVGLIDWDEARIDASILDLAALPVPLETIDETRLARAKRAALAWEVANGWVPESEYARRRLGELQALEASGPL